MAEIKNFLDDKAKKKKSGLKALWLLLILLVVIVAMIVKIVLTGTLKPDTTTGLPTSDDAYTIAKEFIKPTLKSSSADFEDSKYQFGKTSDSVYVIKSSVISKNANNESVTINFKITLKYNGGQASREKNWTLVNIDKN
ncbi:MAG TPA: hypothetical protein VGC01_09830 [Mucilaginibacter sp.]